MERGSGQNQCFDTLSTFDPMIDVDHRSLMSTIDVRSDVRCRPSMLTIDVDHRCWPSMSTIYGHGGRFWLPISHFSHFLFLTSHFLFLISYFSLLISYFSLLISYFSLPISRFHFRFGCHFLLPLSFPALSGFSLVVYRFSFLVSVWPRNRCAVLHVLRPPCRTKPEWFFDLSSHSIDLGLTVSLFSCSEIA